MSSASVQPPASEISQRLEDDRALLVDLTAQLEVRDAQAKGALARVEAQRAAYEARHVELEAQLEVHLAGTVELETTRARLGNELTGWTKLVARAVEPMLVTCALFFALIAWGLNKSLFTTALAEGAGLVVGVALSRVWRARV